LASGSPRDESRTAGKLPARRLPRNDMHLRTISILVVALLLASAAGAHAFGWALVNAKIRSEFPDVPRITTTELAGWLNDPSRPAPLLLDVRTQAEFDVSHLPHARQIDPSAPASTIPDPKNRAIVTYCSVGYRSGAFAKKLLDAGYTNVANLEGSIFRWANEGRQVVSGGRKAEKVHPYDSAWGLLLKRQYRADVPAVDGARAGAPGSVSTTR
jgi:rhodanese-related sulfurtransferase